MILFSDISAFTQPACRFDWFLKTNQLSLHAGQIYHLPYHLPTVYLAFTVQYLLVRFSRTLFCNATYRGEPTVFSLISFLTQHNKLTSIKSDIRYTTTAQLVKLSVNYTISRLLLRISDIKRAKMVSFFVEIRGLLGPKVLGPVFTTRQLVAN